jgi:hydrogenase expression/formation protein HypC
MGIVGRVIEIDGTATSAAPVGTVDTGEGHRAVCFAFLPDAAVGDLVLVHSGFAINRLDDIDIDGGDR